MHNIIKLIREKNQFSELLFFGVDFYLNIFVHPLRRLFFEVGQKHFRVFQGSRSVCIKNLRNIRSSSSSRTFILMVLKTLAKINMSETFWSHFRRFSIFVYCRHCIVLYQLFPSGYSDRNSIQFCEISNSRNPFLGYSRKSLSALRSNIHNALLVRFLLCPVNCHIRSFFFNSKV